jgi:hypothetical protein
MFISNNVFNGNTIPLHNGHHVSAELFDHVRFAVEYRTPELPRGTELTLEEICGEGFWGLLGNGWKRMAGWCMEHLVANNIVPFVYVESRHEYPRHYKLI